MCPKSCKRADRLSILSARFSLHGDIIALTIHAFANVLVCASVQQTPERAGQSEAVYEVVSLQREAERSNEERGRLASPTEEEEADEGMRVSSFSSASPTPSLSLCFFFCFFLLALGKHT